MDDLLKTIFVLVKRQPRNCLTVRALPSGAVLKFFLPITVAKARKPTAMPLNVHGRHACINGRKRRLKAMVYM